jgi:hypothetical protein
MEENPINFPCCCFSIRSQIKYGRRRLKENITLIQTNYAILLSILNPYVYIAAAEENRKKEKSVGLFLIFFRLFPFFYIFFFAFS